MIYNHVKTFFKKWSHPMAYSLGYTATDGYIDKKGYILGYHTHPQDIPALEYIRDHVSPGKPIKYRKNRKSVDLIINSKEIVDSLKKYGIVNKKSKILRLGNVPKKYFYSFLRGAFDGDGHIKDGTNKVIKFTSGSKLFLKDIQKRIGMGSIYKAYDKRNGSVWYDLVVCNYEDILELGHRMYKDSSDSSYLARKKEVFNSIENTFNQKYGN